MTVEYFFQRPVVPDIGVHEYRRPACNSGNTVYHASLAIAQVIDHHDVMPFLQQLDTGMRSYISRATGDQHRGRKLFGCIWTGFRHNQITSAKAFSVLRKNITPVMNITATSPSDSRNPGQ